MIANFSDWINYTNETASPGFVLDGLLQSDLDQFLNENCPDVDKFLCTCSERIKDREFIVAKKDKTTSKILKKSKNTEGLIELLCEIYRNALIRSQNKKLPKIFEKELIEHGQINDYEKLSDDQIDFLVQREKYILKNGRGNNPNWSGGIQRLIDRLIGKNKSANDIVVQVPNKTVTFTISKEINNKFSKFCKEKNINKSKFIDKLINYEIDNYMSNPHDRNFYKLRYRNMKLLQECLEKPDSKIDLEDQSLLKDEPGKSVIYAPGFIKLVDSISVSEFDDNRIKKYNKSKKSVNAETYALYCEMIKRHQNNNGDQKEEDKENK